MKGQRFIFNASDPDAPDSGSGVLKTNQDHLVSGFLFKKIIVDINGSRGEYKVKYSAIAEGRIYLLGGFPVW